MSVMRALVAEFIGTSLLLTAVVGSGIATTSGDPPASVQLFQHALIVGLALGALIALFAPVSGAHFNPLVTAAAWWLGDLPGRAAVGYVIAQSGGAVVGTAVANATAGLMVLGTATRLREGAPVLGGEFLATAALLLLILGLVRAGRGPLVPTAVGAWIAAAILFTSSTSLANPAVTFARSLTDTYVGIAPSSVPAFLAVQGVALVVTVPLAAWLFPVARPARRDDPLTTAKEHP